MDLKTPQGNVMLYRSRLEDTVGHIRYHYSSVVISPPGGGKTTAIKNFLSHAGIDHIFINPHTSPEVIWDRMLKSDYMSRSPEAARCTEKMPRSSDELFLLLERVDSIISAPLFIVIDDAEYFDTAIMNAIFDAFSRIQLKNIHVTYILEHRLFSKKALMTGIFTTYFLDPTDLTFSIDEIKELFSVNGIELSAEEADGIYFDTLGWPYGVKARLKEYCGDPTWEGSYFLNDFLKTRVYDRLDEEEQHILRVLSPLPSFDLRDAMSISGMRKASEIIPKLKTDEFFVSYDRKNGTYSIHPMFRALLTELLMQDPAERLEVVSKSVRWMLERRMVLEAFDLCRNFGEHSLVPEVISADIYHMIPRYRAWEMDSSVARAMENASPLERLAYTFIYAYYSNFRRGRSLLEKFRASQESTDLEADLLAVDMLLGELPPDSSVVCRLLEILEKPEKTPRIVQTHPLMFRGSPLMLMLFRAAPGALRETVAGLCKLCEKTGSFFINGSESVVSQMKAEYAYFTGDLGAAVEYASEARYRSRGFLDYSGYLILIKALHALGRSAEADEILEELRGGSTPATHKPGFVLHASDAIAATAAWISGRRISINRPAMFYRNNLADMDHFMSSCVFFAMDLLQKEDMLQLKKLAEEMSHVFKDSGSALGQTYAGIFAAAALKKSDPEAAAAKLASAFAAAQPDGLVTPFAEFWPHISAIEITPALKKKAGISQDFLHKVGISCSFFVHAPGALQAEKPALRLTSREKDIMEAYSKGLTQSEIAARYGISIETVRQHLKNIYAKMGVNKKSAAVEIFNSIIKK